MTLTLANVRTLLTMFLMLTRASVKQKITPMSIPDCSFSILSLILNIFHCILAEVVHRHLRSLNSSKTPMVSALHLSSSFIRSQYKDTKPLLVGWFFSKKLLHSITRATRVMEEEVAEPLW